MDEVIDAPVDDALQIDPPRGLRLQNPFQQFKILLDQHPEVRTLEPGAAAPPSSTPPAIGAAPSAIPARPARGRGLNDHICPKPIFAVRAEIN
jgi:hypothetical protein